MSDRLDILTMVVLDARDAEPQQAERIERIAEALPELVAVVRAARRVRKVCERYKYSTCIERTVEPCPPCALVLALEPFTTKSQVEVETHG